MASMASRDGKTKVAHVTTVDMSLRYLLLDQMRRIQDGGYEVVGISSPGEHVPVLEAAGIRHLSVRMTRSLTPLRDLIALAQLTGTLWWHDFDIVHVHTPKASLLGQLAARAAGVPIVVNTVHGFYFHEHMSPLKRKAFVLLERLGAGRADVLLSQSREDAETAVREGIVSRDRIKVLGNGIDLERFDPAALPEGHRASMRASLGIPELARVVGFVGRLVAEKGVPELFEAMAEVMRERPDVWLLVVGPVDREKADALGPETARAHGIEDRCIFTGLRQDMPELYGAMDLLALPSHREGFPRAPMEASAMGLPCVVTDVRGCREAVDPDRNGRIVPVRSPGPLGAAIAEILDDDELATRLGQGGRALAYERFDQQLVFEAVLAEYERLRWRLESRGWMTPAAQEAAG